MKLREISLRLKSASRFCEFEKLGTQQMTIEEEMIQLRFIQLRFIERLHNSNQRDMVLERLQSTEMRLETCVEFVQQLEMISDFKEDTQNKVVFQVKKEQNNTVLQMQKPETKGEN